MRIPLYSLSLTISFVIHFSMHGPQISVFSHFALPLFLWHFDLHSSSCRKRLPLLSIFHRNEVVPFLNNFSSAEFADGEVKTWVEGSLGHAGNSVQTDFAVLVDSAEIHFSSAEFADGEVKTGSLGHAGNSVQTDFAVLVDSAEIQEQVEAHLRQRNPSFSFF